MVDGSTRRAGLNEAASIGTAANAIRVAFEAPLNEGEARSRALPADVSRLVLSRRSSAVDDRVVVGVCAELIRGWKGPAEDVYLVPMNSFLSEKRLRQLVDRVGLHEVSKGSEVAFRCETQTTLIEGLVGLDCEEVVVFWAHGDSAAHRVLEAAGAYRGPGAGYDALYVCADTGLEAVGFYAASHVSLEVLGQKDFVVDRCLPSVLTYVLRSTG